MVSRGPGTPGLAVFMTQLPTHAPTRIEVAARAAHRAISAAQGADAVYRKGNQGDGVLIRVLVGGDQIRAGSFSPRSHSLQGQQRRRSIQISITANPAGTDAGGGITDVGDVIELNAGDSIELSDMDLGGNTSETRRITVPKAPKLDQRAIWIMEAAYA